MKKTPAIKLFISLWKLEFGYEPVSWDNAMLFKAKTFPLVGLDNFELGIRVFENAGWFNEIERDGWYTQLVSEPVSIMEDV